MAFITSVYWVPLHAVHHGLLGLLQLAIVLLYLIGGIWNRFACLYIQTQCKPCSTTWIVKNTTLLSTIKRVFWIQPQSWTCKQPVHQERTRQVESVFASSNFSLSDPSPPHQRHAGLPRQTLRFSHEGEGETCRSSVFQGKA